MEVFSARLKWLREKAGISQKDMAEYLGISQPYYGRFEKGTAQPNLEALSLLPKKLGESLDFLCGVIFLDTIGENLMYEYYRVREYYEKQKTKYESTIHIIKNEIESDLERAINIIARTHSLLEDRKNVMDEAFENLINHINTIPATTDGCKTEDYWNVMYTDYYMNHRYYIVD